MADELIRATAVEPVTAEIVPPAPSPWRFGLKALLGLMAVCCVQFSLMNYFGVLVGLVLGIAACAALFTVILFAGMFLSGGWAKWLPQLDLLVVRLMVAIVVLLFGSILAGGGTAAYQQFARTRMEQVIESKLGLSLSRETYLRTKTDVTTALLVTGVKDGSAAHQAGLAQDDVIVVDGTIDEFIQRLYDNRGKDVDVNVASGVTTGTTLESCPQRSVTLSIPK